MKALNIWGLDLLIDTDGTVFASQSGIARMLGHDNDVAVRRHISKLFPYEVPVRIQVNAGGKRSNLYGSKVIGVLLSMYQPKRLPAFLDICTSA